MVYIKLTVLKLISIISCLLAVMIFISYTFFKNNNNTFNATDPCHPCSCSDQTSHIDTRLISTWDRERLEELWKVQGIPKHDTGGGINPRQARRYMELASMDSKFKVKTVCETGFFRGGSTLFWLMLFPESIVHSFDISFPESAVKWFENKYPGRLITHTGDSKVLIPGLPANSCDWVSVDGDHGQGGAHHDIREFSKVSKPMALLVSDDTFDCKLSASSCTECGFNCPCSGSRPFCNECSDGFHRSVDENIIDWIGCDRYGVSSDRKYPIGSCHGYFRSLTSL